MGTDKAGLATRGDNETNDISLQYRGLTIQSNITQRQPIRKRVQVTRRYLLN